LNESKDKLAASGSASGAASKGNTTPSGKTKEASKAKSLKRPGSPNLSEASDTEGSRKKAKKLATGSARPSRSTTPVPGQSFSKGKGGATSDGEMSDGGKAKTKIKVVGTNGKGTPMGSRAGSPVPSALGKSTSRRFPPYPHPFWGPTSPTGLSLISPGHIRHS